LKKFRQQKCVLEAVSYGIVAQCGSGVNVLALPISQRVDLDRLGKAEPQVARLWRLLNEIADSSFGPDIFYDRNRREALTLQQDAPKFIDEARSGRYDLGLRSAVSGNVDVGDGRSFRSLLEEYRGSLRIEEVPQGRAAWVLTPNGLRFSHFAEARYPSTFLHGKVELEVTADPSSGEVAKVVAGSGNPLLQASAMEAAKEWRFEPSSLSSPTFSVLLDYADHCRR
jgi:hypothetical protein